MHLFTNQNYDEIQVEANLTLSHHWRVLRCSIILM
jgi:hypothetical protein